MIAIFFCGCQQCQNIDLTEWSEMARPLKWSLSTLFRHFFFLAFIWPSSFTKAPLFIIVVLPLSLVPVPLSL